MAEPELSDFYGYRLYEPVFRAERAGSFAVSWRAHENSQHKKAEISCRARDFQHLHRLSGGAILCPSAAGDCVYGFVSYAVPDHDAGDPNLRRAGQGQALADYRAGVFGNPCRVSSGVLGFQSVGGGGVCRNVFYRDSGIAGAQARAGGDRPLAFVLPEPFCDARFPAPGVINRGCPFSGGSADFYYGRNHGDGRAELYRPRVPGFALCGRFAVQLPADDLGADFRGGSFS